MGDDSIKEDGSKFGPNRKDNDIIDNKLLKFAAKVRPTKCSPPKSVFKVGDVVQLNSGGPAMTVTHVFEFEGLVSLIGFDPRGENTIEIERISEECLSA